MVAPLPVLAAAERAIRTATARREARHDAGLVRRFKAGDEAAFVEIVTRYRPRMWQAAFRLLHNRADAEEIAQDTFIRAHRNLALFRGDASLCAWLHCIALNLARNRYWYFFRRRRHTTRALDEPCTADSRRTFADLIASNIPDPGQAAITRELAELTAAGLARLKPAQREILTLRNGAQSSYLGIARTLGINVGTVKSRIARARRELRGIVAAHYFPGDPAFIPPAGQWFNLRPAAGCLVNA